MPHLSRLPMLGLAIVLLQGGFSHAGTSEWTPSRVADGICTLIGPTGPRTAENDALNCNIGFVVTQQGVLLIDSGASWMGAKWIARAVDSVPDQPIRWVINTGSQDHRWLGNGYFAERGAKIIALQRTVETQKGYADSHLANLHRVLGERLAGTEPTTATAPLAGDQAHLNLGGVDLELIFLGDAVLWLPQQRVHFAGDLVYADRLLGVLSRSRVPSWRAAFERMKTLKPKVIVPGHRSVGDLAKAQRDTGGYLDWLIEDVGTAQADWEPLDEVVRRLAGAPQFSHLANFQTLHRSNINRAHLEFERGGD